MINTLMKSLFQRSFHQLQTELGVVTNKLSNMSSLKDPSKRLDQIVSRVDNTWYMKYFIASILLPILYSKVLNINMTSSLIRNTDVDNHDSWCIIFIDRGRIRWVETKYSEDRLQVSYHLSTGNSSNKISFSRAESNNGLCVLNELYWKAVTGVVHFYNKTLVNWYCKKQSTTESATYGFGFLACQTCFDKSSIIDNTFDILEYRYTRRTVHGETTMLWLIVLLFLIQSYINDITFCPFTLLEVWLHVDILIYSTLSQNAILPIFLLNIGVTKVRTNWSI